VTGMTRKAPDGEIRSNRPKNTQEVGFFKFILLIVR